MIAMYGIRNCDTVKKARLARRARHPPSIYKAEGVDPGVAARARELGWERMLNRSGTTFRKLPDADRSNSTRPRRSR